MQEKEQYYSAVKEIKHTEDLRNALDWNSRDALCKNIIKIVSAPREVCAPDGKVLTKMFHVFILGDFKVNNKTKLIYVEVLEYYKKETAFIVKHILFDKEGEMPDDVLDRMNMDPEKEFEKLVTGFMVSEIKE